MRLLWITKNAQSKTLSRSEGEERLALLSQAQTVSRQQKAVRRRKTSRRWQAAERRSFAPVKQEHGDICHIRNARDRCDTGEQCNGDNFDDDDCNIQSCYGYRWSPLVVESFLQRDCSWTPAERRSAVYLQEVAVYKILTLKRDNDFWRVTLPCLAEIDISIRHLVVAIAATYELLFCSDATSLNRFALRQCNKALHAILSSNDISHSSLITSSILVAAYHLLRSDTEAADKSIKSGLAMLVGEENTTGIISDQTSRILTSLGQQHGFKLWTADVVFRIDAVVPSHEDFIIPLCLPRGPFTDIEQVLAAFKLLMVELVMKPMRNLALGAYIDRDSFFTHDVNQCFSDILYYWDLLYNSLPSSLQDEELQLIQLKIGLLFARLLFHAKLLAADELRPDEYITTFAEIAQLGQEVITARHEDREVIYLDRIVNSALFSCSMFCREPRIRRQLISLLKGQVMYPDGLVNFVRGHISEILMELEEHGLVVDRCSDIPGAQRVGMCTLECAEDRILCIGYMMAVQTDRVDLKYHYSRLPPTLDRFGYEEIDNCLKGMMAAFQMYRKQDLRLAPKGYLRKMYWGTRPVRLAWRADLVYRYERQRDDLIS